ncbi:MAG: glycogen debranching protein, partial [Gemmatimonadaceae bacterium]
MRVSWAGREGAPLPLGVTWVPDEHAYNFALYSKHAERVVLLAFGEDDVSRPVFSLELDYLRHKSGRIWHCRVPKSDLRDARYYGYSVDGPAPAGVFSWHTFDPSKVLLDPYADAVHFPPAFDREAAAAWGANAGRAPLGVIPGAAQRDEDDAEDGVDRPQVALHETDAVIYELHV